MGKAICVAAAVVAAIGFSHSAEAAGAQGLRDNLLKNRPAEGRRLSAPPIARYVSEDGHVFILDRSQTRPLLKFEDSPEVWALQPQPAPRGDVIYKNDLGEPMLRATRLGGVTLFTEHRPGGEAVSLAGGGPPLRLAPLGPQALLERLAQASLRASRAARRPILFEAEATPASSALIADAALVTSMALARISERGNGKAPLARIRKVRLVEGKRATAAIDSGVLLVTVAPAQGLAGRPSSERIVKVATRR